MKTFITFLQLVLHDETISLKMRVLPCCKCQIQGDLNHVVPWSEPCCSKILNVTFLQLVVLFEDFCFRNWNASKHWVVVLHITGSSFNKPLVKCSVATLKRTGAPFIQDGPCSEVTPKLSKCRECKPNQRGKKIPNIFCRFYAFRRYSSLPLLQCFSYMLCVYLVTWPSSLLILRILLFSGMYAFWCHFKLMDSYK